MRVLILSVAVFCLWGATLHAKDNEKKKKTLDAITGYQQAEWGDTVAEVEFKMGPLTEKEGLYFQEGSLKGLPAYVQYRFLNDKLIEIGLVLNAPDYPKSAYPPLYERVHRDLVRIFDYPTKEDKSLLDFDLMPFEQQLANGYVKWVSLWSGKQTAIVLGMTTVNSDLILYMTYFPANISEEGHPNPEAQR